MESISRRTILGSAAAGLLSAAATNAFSANPATSPTSGPVENSGAPEPHRGEHDGGRILGPQNPELQRQNPDLISPPKSDHGKVMNLRWSFTDSHVRVEPGGWSRETTLRELPVSTQMAGVNMRLKKGAFRELHWHSAAEWAFMIKGKARITAIDENGNLFVDDVGEGELWFFPAGIPHSIQGLDSDYPEGGCEFLLVFDDGNFSEDSTFLLTDLLQHMPAEIVMRTLNITKEQLEKLPKKELFIYPCEMPESLDQERKNRNAGPVPQSFSLKQSQMKPIRVKGGTVTIMDTTIFPASKGIIAAKVELEPGAIRELHWHTSNGDEWQFFMSGFGRQTVFISGSAARTFNYRAGDVGYVPATTPHYIQNLGDTPLTFLEVFKASKYEDVSLRQWLALTPPNLVAGHLMLPKELLTKLPPDKPLILA